MLKFNHSGLVFIRPWDIHCHDIESLSHNADSGQISIHSFSRASSHQHEYMMTFLVLYVGRNITILILRVKFGQTDYNIFVSIGP